MTDSNYTLVPPRTGWSGRLSAGTAFRVIDTSGGQAADLWVFHPADPARCLSAHHSRVHMGQVYPTAGWTFVDNEREPVLEFVEDSSPGRHDCLAAACDRRRYELLGGGSDHGSCEENMQHEMARYGYSVAHAPQPINVFANFRVQPDGAFTLEECVSGPGDAATFRLLTDGIVVLSACPQDIVKFQPGGPSEMAVEVLDG